MGMARGRRGIHRSTINFNTLQPFLIVTLISHAVTVNSLPQRGSVHFPAGNQAYPFMNSSSYPNSRYPILYPSQNGSYNHPNNQNNSHHNNGDFDNEHPSNQFPSSPPSGEFLIGSSGISCDRPGQFVLAPDGCNRCLCAHNKQLSSACSRALCPPGFPSSSKGQYKKM